MLINNILFGKYSIKLDVQKVENDVISFETVFEWTWLVICVYLERWQAMRKPTLSVTYL